MPYQTIKDLPANIKQNLPTHAQEIYLKAFNNAFAEYKDEGKRRTNETREETAHKVAWSAVKKKYHKDSNGVWIEGRA